MRVLIGIKAKCKLLQGGVFKRREIVDERDGNIQRRQRHAAQWGEVVNESEVQREIRQRHPFERREIGDCHPGKIQLVNGNPLSRARSVTGVELQSITSSGSPCSGDRSETRVPTKARVVSCMPRRGDKSANSPACDALALHARCRRPGKARTGEISVMLSVKNPNPFTLPFFDQRRLRLIKNRSPSHQTPDSIPRALTDGFQLLLGSRAATSLTHASKPGVSKASGFFFAPQPPPLPSRTPQPVCR